MVSVMQQMLPALSCSTFIQFGFSSARANTFFEKPIVGSPGAENNGSGENSGLKTTEQEVEWLQVSVNATTDAR